MAVTVVWAAHGIEAEIDDAGATQLIGEMEDVGDRIDDIVGVEDAPTVVLRQRAHLDEDNVGLGRHTLTVGLSLGAGGERR